MEIRTIGSLDVSVVGLGCNSFGARCDDETSTAVIRAAIEAGITFFDTADVYGMGRSEELLGAAVHGHRDDVVIATKFGASFGDDIGHRGAGARWIVEAAEASLRRLGTDRIDLYQQHLPDGSVPIEETLEALDALVRTGKVREIGTSNVTVAETATAIEVSHERGWAPFVSVQNRCSVVTPDAVHEVARLHEHRGTRLIPYAPLEGGLLSGKYTRGVPAPEGTRLAQLPESGAAAVLSDENFDLIDALAAFASVRGHTLLDLAMGWLVSQPVVGSVIAGATSVDQVRANLAAAAAAWRLPEDDLVEVGSLRRTLRPTR